MVVYKGKKYYLHKSGYWIRERIRKGQPRRRWLLHREVWEDHHGSIPPQCTIHHKDEDKSNWMLENLECLTRSAHTRLHRLKDLQEGRLEKFKEIGLWLTQSVKGRALRRAGYDRWRREKPLEVGECEVCGKVMEIIIRTKRFCSQACQKRNYFRRKYTKEMFK